jgi:hypothetical protein
VVAQTATQEQAQALAEGLRRRGIDASQSYVDSLEGDIPAPTRPYVSPEARERIDESKRESDEYYGKMRGSIDAGRYAAATAVAARELTQSLARINEQGGQISESERFTILDSIRNAQRHLADAVALLNTEMSVSEAATEFLKNIG